MRGFALGALLILVCISPVFALPPDSRDLVSFRFLWPSTFNAQVGDNRAEAGSNSKQMASSTVGTSFKVAASPHSSGIRLHYLPVKVEMESTFPATMNQFLRDVVLVSQQNFQFVDVSSQGSISIPNFEDCVAQSVADLTSKTTSLNIPKELIKQVFSTANLAAAVQDQWGRMVQMWIGVELQVGTLYRAVGHEYVPQIGREVSSETYFRIIARVPCNEGDNTSDCVLIEGKSIPDESEIQTFFRSGYPGSTKGGKTAIMFSLVTDPNSLMPYLYQESREGVFGDASSLSISRITYKYL